MCQSVCAKAVLKEKFTMTILDSVKGTVNTAVDTISSVAAGKNDAGDLCG